MSRSKNIVLSPFIIAAVGNIGDEAILKGFATLAHPYLNNYKFYLSAHDLAQARKVAASLNYYKNGIWDIGLRLRVPSAKCGLIIGDTPISDVLYPWPLNQLSNWIRILRNRPIGFIGIGTEPLTNPKSLAIVRNQIAPLVKIWTTRNLKDKQRLENYGVASENIVVAADMAWLNQPVDQSYGQEKLKSLGIDLSCPLVGINVTNESFIVEQSPRFFDILAEFADRLIAKHNLAVAFFANDVREVDYVDKMASFKIIKRMKERKNVYVIPNQYYTPQEMLSLISNCHLTVASRYHFCLFSALQSIPFIAIKRQEKLADLCVDLDWQFSSNLIEMETNKLAEMYSQIDSNYQQWTGHLSNYQKIMSQRAIKNGIVLEILLRT